MNSTLLRKAFWPALVAIAALLVVGAFTAPRAQAGDVVAICGPALISEGETVIYVAQFDNLGGTGDIPTTEVDLNDISGDSDITSELLFDDEGSEADDEWEYSELDNPTDYLSNLEIVRASAVFDFTVGEDGDLFFPESFLDLLDAIDEDFDIDLFDFMFFEDCGLDEEGFLEDFEDVVLACVKGQIHIEGAGIFNIDGESGDVILDPFIEWNWGSPLSDEDVEEIEDADLNKCNVGNEFLELDEDDEVESGYWTDRNNETDDSALTGPGDIGLSPTEIATAVAEIILDDPDLFFDCDDLFDEVNEFLVDEGVSVQIADFIANDFFQLCVQGDFFGDIEGFALVDVTCEEAGVFELSFEPNQNDSEPNQIQVQCVGDPDDAEIDANPTTVEIVPARGSTSASLITLNLLDEGGDATGAGVTVVWTTDRCRLSDDGISVPGRNDDWENMIAEALEVFGDFNRNTAQTALDINVFVDGLDQTTRTSVEADAFALGDDAGDFDEGDVISAVILDCSATSNTPGIAKVMACIDVEGADICKTVNVTVVGPPVAPVVLTTDQTNVRCGERVQITATIKDAAGQNVSDHTLVEVATNAGGVLGGTGAIAGEAGLVSPVSSTVAETNNGVTTFWLITSELHQGTYTVLVTTGGGGSVAGQLLGGLFSTPPVSGSVTVTCNVPGSPTTTAPQAPSPAATVTAPRTGQGITPPSTGDAGLADASGGSWALFVIAGLTVFALAGVASLKAVRR